MRAFAGHERGQSTGAIDGRSFTAVLARDARITLSAPEESLLLSHYEARVGPGGRRGQVDYRRFLEDIRRAGAGKVPAAVGVSLSVGQEKLLAAMKKWFGKEKDKGALLAV